MDSNIERWYSMKEICEYLGVSRDTVLAWIDKREMHEDRQAVEIQNQRSGRLDEIRRCGREIIGDLHGRKEIESL